MSALMFYAEINFICVEILVYALNIKNNIVQIQSIRS